MSMIDRRSFLHASAAGVAALANVAPLPAFAETKKPKLKKAVKFDMIKIKGSIEQKFDLIKKLGFLGVEMNSPSNIDRKEAVAARDKTGIAIHGVIDSIHWDVRLSDPDAAVRAKGLDALMGALEDAKVYGADTVLLVPGKVANKEKENYDQVWERSQIEIRKAMPLAEKLGVRIAIEVVWNDFITTPDEWVKYIDEFKNPIVGGYFDCSNMVKFGVKSGDWIAPSARRGSANSISKGIAKPSVGSTSAKATKIGRTSSRLSAKSATMAGPQPKSRAAARKNSRMSPIE